MTPDAIFFDFDGVLAESTPLKIEAFNALYADRSPEVRAQVAAYMKEREGISRVVKIREAHKAFLGIDLSDEALAAEVERYAAMVVEAVVACPWVPGAREFLGANHGKFPMFVVTGTPETEILRIVERRDMDHYFDSVRGSPPTKPPIVRELLSAYGLTAGRCLFVGDASFDYETARETGLHFIGRVPQGEPSPFPDGTALIRDLIQLPVALDRLSGYGPRNAVPQTGMNGR